MAKKIAFVNGKGGVGKSTLTYLVCLSLRQAKQGVRIEDLDPQKTLESIVEIEEGGKESNFILVDTPPNLLADDVINTIKEADIIVIPCTPDPFAMPVTISTAETVEKFKRDEAKVFVVLNQVQSGTKLSTAIPKVLEQKLPFPISETNISARQSIKRISLEGWGGLDSDIKETVLKLALEIIGS